MKHLRAKKPRPKTLIFDTDHIRRRFFEDFPFEALRPVTLVEGETVGEGRETLVDGEDWVELKQRGDYPTVENTIQYIANLHNNFHLSLSQAYTRGVEQFVELRALHEIATFAAETEAVYHGATYKKNVFERFRELEDSARSTLASPSYAAATASSSPIANAPRLPWSPTLLPEQKSYGSFTGGIAYSTAWARREDWRQKQLENEEQSRLYLESGKPSEEQVGDVVAASESVAPLS